jgi:hypothetical protein
MTYLPVRFFTSLILFVTGVFRQFLFEISGLGGFQGWFGLAIQYDQKHAELIAIQG